MTDGIVVETASGRLRGVAERGVGIFKGIPYAAPPLGERRFRTPRKAEPWSGVRDAFGYGNMAVQKENPFDLPADLLAIFPFGGVEKVDEDCLYLNVWTSGLGGRKRPVLFWCHGGVFIAGSGSSPWTDGANLCRLDDVVVVSFDHRLGALGYPHLEGIAGDGFAGAGTAGMRDIVMALEWVSGGAKVSVLMALLAAQGLFHEAIIQSGPAVQMANRTRTARQVLERLGLDDRIAPGAPAVSAQVPLLIGSNKDEMTWLFSHLPWVAGATFDSLPEGLEPYLGDRTTTSASDTSITVVSDLGIRSQSLQIADCKLAQKAAEVFVYFFAWETPVPGGRLRSCHALEIPFVFNNLRTAALTGDDPRRFALGERMARAWIDVARNCNPGWPAYSTRQRPTMVFDTVCRVESDPYGAERRVWEEMS